MKVDKARFRRVLKREMKARNMDTTKLSNRLKHAHSTIRRWERGKSVPHYEHWPEIAAALSVPISVFLPDGDSPALAEGMRTAITEVEATLGRLRETADRIEVEQMRLTEMERADKRKEAKKRKAK